MRDVGEKGILLRRKVMPKPHQRDRRDMSGMSDRKERSETLRVPAGVRKCEKKKKNGGVKFEVPQWLHGVQCVHG